ncbi:MAG: nucleotidyltransferase family protein [Alphaproteobacteria bacterium HGW-Alphaproteobacteria-1]|nr:MAG: nucleotidyltransferase family protein [Alphaproteobacteria bacterium HGW-Alphaproteobacteria-1]
MAVAVLLPAAGASRRMRGRDKLLEVVRGRALLRERAEVALTISDDVLVTLPPGGGPRGVVLDGLPVARREVAQAAEGMAASLRAGADWAQERGAEGLMVLLPDMPDLRQEDLKIAVQAFDKKTILRATSEDGRSGHPVIFPAALLPEMAALTGDEGARALLSCHAVTLCPLPGERAVTDLDTPEEWAAWRARNS